MTKQTTEQFMQAHGFEWEPETEFFKPGIWTYKMPGTAEFSLTNVQAEFMHRTCQEAEAAARAEAVMKAVDTYVEGVIGPDDQLQQITQTNRWVDGTEVQKQIDRNQLRAEQRRRAKDVEMCDVKTCTERATWVRKSKNVKGGIIRFCEAHGRAAGMIEAIQ